MYEDKPKLWKALVEAGFLDKRAENKRTPEEKMKSARMLLLRAKGAPFAQHAALLEKAINELSLA